jgi:2'-5' RNA ligase
MPRLFTALEIPSDIGQSLALLRGGLPGARWVAPELYHLSLRFIGDIDDVLAGEIADMLGKSNGRDSTCGSTVFHHSAATSRVPWWRRCRPCRSLSISRPIMSG